MKRVRTKYTLRKDGRICRTETINGERKYFYGYSDEEVDAKYEAAISESNKPLLISELIDKWWNKKEAEISPNTFPGYLTAKNRIFQKFGELPAKDLTPQLIIAYLEEFKRLQYSQKVISNTKSVLKQIMDEAIITGEILLHSSDKRIITSHNVVESSVFKLIDQLCRGITSVEQNQIR